jgi:hypothetical protein
MEKWKIPAIFAGVGALISLIAGVAGGNPFGLVLLRVLFCLLAAGGVGLAIQYVLRRYLPELGGQTAAGSNPAVDIVIDEDLALGGPERDLKGEEEAAPLSAAESQFAAEQPLPEAGLELEAPLEAESLAEEAVEPLPQTVGELEAGPLEMLPEAEEERFLEGSLDSLPDIAGDEPVRPARRASTIRGELAEARVDSLLKGQDPAVMAKAVRTFLKKDQEG